MRPIIKKEEILLLKKEGKEQISSGDIIGFIAKRPGRAEAPLVHRVTRISQMGILTSADTSLKPDPLVKMDDVVGKVVKIKIKGKWRKYDGKLLIRGAGISIALLSRIIIRNPEFKLAVFIRGLLARITRLTLEMS